MEPGPARGPGGAELRFSSSPAGSGAAPEWPADGAVEVAPDESPGDGLPTPRAAELRARRLFTALSLLGLIGVFYADAVVPGVSLGFLYLLPLALFAAAQRAAWSLGLAAACVLLRELHAPPQPAATLVARSLFAGFGYFSVALLANRFARQRAALTERVEQQRDELIREARLAAEVQRQVLPREAVRIEDFELRARILPLRGVGGDLYDVFRLPNGDVGLVIGDVAGKGMAAALLMPLAVATLRIHARAADRPETAMERVNQSIFEVVEQGRYVSLFYARLDPARRRLDYVNAGHFPPLVLRAGTAEREWLSEGGPVAGLLESSRYQAGSVELSPGDVLVLYTDGIVEAESPEGEEFGRERLAGAVESSAGLPPGERLERCFGAVVEFHGAATLEDDATLVLLQAGAGASTPDGRDPALS